MNDEERQLNVIDLLKEQNAALREKLEAAGNRIEALEQLIAGAAPVTWASGNWLDDAVSWEREAAELLGIGKE